MMLIVIQGYWSYEHGTHPKSELHAGGCGALLESFDEDE